MMLITQVDGIHITTDPRLKQEQGNTSKGYFLPSECKPIEIPKCLLIGLGREPIREQNGWNFIYLGWHGTVNHPNNQFAKHTLTALSWSQTDAQH